MKTNSVCPAKSDSGQHLQVLLSVAVWARLEVLHILGLERAILDGRGKHSQLEARTPPPASKFQRLLSIFLHASKSVPIACGPWQGELMHPARYN